MSEEFGVWRFVCPEGDFTSEYNPVEQVYADETCPECGEAVGVEQAVWASELEEVIEEFREDNATVDPNPEWTKNVKEAVDATLKALRKEVGLKSETEGDSTE